MAFINDDEVVIGEIIKQTERTGAWRAPVKIPGVVFYTWTKTQFPDHLEIVVHPLGDPPGLLLLAYVLEKIDLLEQVLLNLFQG
jgi:hypothetical protein